MGWAWKFENPFMLFFRLGEFLVEMDTQFHPLKHGKVVRRVFI